MQDDLTHAERVKTLVDNPTQFDELLEAYNNEVNFYQKARNNAPTSLDTFEEYLELYRIFIEQGPTSFVYDQLERYTVRSLKNMILRDSAAGQQYPVQTLTDVHTRVNDYQELGVRSVSLRDVVENTVEHIYSDDAHEDHAYAIFTTLLVDTPDTNIDAVEFVARARLIDGLLNRPITEELITAELEAYANAVSDPRPDDDRTVKELREEASTRPYSDPEIVELNATALYRGVSPGQLIDYLYFSARDVVERYRHGHRDDPSVAELLLAKHQLMVLLEVDTDWEEEREAYLRSYSHLVNALIDSSGQWRTGRDSQKAPETDFARAADEYLAAALAIQETNDDRFVKYLSKALRQATNAMDSWAAKEQIHDYALVLMHEQLQEGGPEETIEGTIAYHRYLKTEAAAYVAFVQGNPDLAHEKMTKAEELINELPQSKIGSFRLDQICALAEGRILEQNGDFDEAANRYAAIEKSSKQIEAREKLARVKHQTMSGSAETALQRSEEAFGEGSLVTSTVQALAEQRFGGREQYGTSPNVLLADKTSIEESLQLLLRLYETSDEAHDQFKPFLRETFKRL